MSTSVIQCDAVEKVLNGKQILRRIDLNICQGSVVGLLGRNGAGKTTLIKVMLGLLKRSGGMVRIFGDDAWALTDSVKHRLGYVPQNARLYPWLTVRQLLDYTASFYDRWNTVWIAHLCAEWGIDVSARMGHLSEGESQKVMILLALGHEPELLILDEPVASLDPRGRRQFLQTILDHAADRGGTVFFSTHITSDLERVADHVAILHQGVIRFMGELDVLKDSVKRLRIIGKAVNPQEIAQQDVLHYEATPEGTIVSIRDFSPASADRLAGMFGTDVRVDDLNLEEIFLEMSR